MSDFAKSIVIMLLTIIVSHIATVATLSADSENIKITLEKLDKKIEKFDERQRETEIQVATLLAAN